MVKKKYHDKSSLLFTALRVASGKHYGVAVRDISYVSGSHGYTVKVRRFNNITSPNEPAYEEFIMQPPQSILVRFRPFNFITRGRDIYFIPPRFYPRPKQGLFVIGAIVTSDDVKRSKDYSIVHLRRGVVFDYNGAIPFGERNVNNDAVNYALKMIENTGFGVRKTANQYELTHINMYKVNQANISRKTAIVYLLVHVDDNDDITLASVLVVNVGMYPGNRLYAVIADAPSYDSTLRFVAVGFRPTELTNDLLDGVSRFNNIYFDFSEFKKEFCKPSKKQSNIIRRLCDSLSFKKFTLNMSDLSEKKVKINIGRSYIEVDAIDVDDILDARESLHFLRDVQINLNILTDIDSSGANMTRLLEVPLAGKGSGTLLVEALNEVNSTLQLVSFNFNYKRMSSLVPQLQYPHLFITLGIKSSKALRFRLEDISNRDIAAIFATSSTFSKRFPHIEGLRFMLLRHAYPPGLIDDTPLVCFKKQYESLMGYINFFEFGHDIARALICNKATDGSLRKQLRCDDYAESIVQLISDFLKLSKELETSRPELISQEIQKFGMSKYLGCSMVFSFAYVMVKAFAQIFGRFFLESNIVACDSDKNGCEVYIVEANDYGIGFVDAVERDRGMLIDAVRIALDIAESCNYEDYMKYIASKIDMLKSNDRDIDAAEKCFSELLGKLEEIGIIEPPLDLIRVIYHEYLRLCNKYKHRQKSLCSDVCMTVAENLFKSKQGQFLRTILPEIYLSKIPLCWDGCLMCSQISQRVLNTGLTNHEQMLFVSKTLAKILASIVANIYSTQGALTRSNDDVNNREG